MSKSFRIKGPSGFATVWPISDYFYSVLYECEENTLTVSADLVQNLFRREIWQKVNNEDA